jgi:hypothetical protein
MIRKDKEITDFKLICEIISANNICRIALSENNIPYIVPVNYGFNGKSLFIHSAKYGKKIDIIKNNPSICFEVSDSIRVLLSENPCGSGTMYRSVIGFGKITEITDNDNKIKCLNIIMKHHTGKESWKFHDLEINKVSVFEIEIDYMTGKISGIKTGDT